METGLGIGFGYHLLPHVRHNMNELGWRGHDMSGVVLTKVCSSKNESKKSVREREGTGGEKVRNASEKFSLFTIKIDR
jgi:hypothetical protein